MYYTEQVKVDRRATQSLTGLSTQEKDLGLNEFEIVSISEEVESVRDGFRVV